MLNEKKQEVSLKEEQNNIWEILIIRTLLKNKDIKFDKYHYFPSKK